MNYPGPPHLCNVQRMDPLVVTIHRSAMDVLPVYTRGAKSDRPEDKGDSVSRGLVLRSS